ncbi:MAG: hypothetical protein CMJ35_11595 [Phycisphaerae bacterium]|nr:hypothetical protein [Phycisphaerae bacterium]
MGGGFGSVAEEVGEAGEGEGLGLVFEELAAVGVDAHEAGVGAFEAWGGEEVVELLEGEVVELAEFGGGDGGVEEVVDEGFEGEGSPPPSAFGGHLPRAAFSGFSNCGGGERGPLRLALLGTSPACAGEDGGGFVMLQADGRLGARVVRLWRSNPWHPGGGPLRAALAGRLLRSAYGGSVTDGGGT